MGDRQFLNSMGNFTTMVTIISSEVDNDAFGMANNAFVSVSLELKLYMF